MKITCSVAQLCPACLCMRPKLMDRAKSEILALGPAVLALALSWLQRDRNSAGQLGKASHIWDSSEVLMKLPCSGSKEYLGKRCLEPTSTKYKHRKAVSEEESWEHDVAAGGLWRQLRQGQWQFPCSSLFLHLHRGKPETGLG